jgi:hypothetical protein
LNLWGLWLPWDLSILEVLSRLLDQSHLLVLLIPWDLLRLLDPSRLLDQLRPLDLSHLLDLSILEDQLLL